MATSFNPLPHFNNPQYANLTLTVGSESLHLHNILVLPHCPTLEAINSKNISIPVEHSIEAVTTCMRWFYGEKIACVSKLVPQCLLFAEYLKSAKLVDALTVLMTPGQSMVHGMPVNYTQFEQDIIRRGFEAAVEPILATDDARFVEIIKSIGIHSKRFIAIALLKAKGKLDHNHLTLIPGGTYSQNHVNVIARLFPSVAGTFPFMLFASDEAIVGALELKVLEWNKGA